MATFDYYATSLGSKQIVSQYETAAVAVQSTQSLRLCKAYL